MITQGINLNIRDWKGKNAREQSLTGYPLDIVLFDQAVSDGLHIVERNKLIL